MVGCSAIAFKIDPTIQYDEKFCQLVANRAQPVAFWNNGWLKDEYCKLIEVFTPKIVNMEKLRDMPAEIPSSEVGLYSSSSGF